mgnify:CR=1 FL=1
MLRKLFVGWLNRRKTELALKKKKRVRLKPSDEPLVSLKHKQRWVTKNAPSEINYELGVVPWSFANLAIRGAYLLDVFHLGI